MGIQPTTTARYMVGSTGTLPADGAIVLRPRVHLGATPVEPAGVKAGVKTGIHFRGGETSQFKYGL